jgi:hypothetical protein
MGILAQPSLSIFQGGNGQRDLILQELIYDLISSSGEANYRFQRLNTGSVSIHFLFKRI